MTAIDRPLITREAFEKDHRHAGWGIALRGVAAVIFGLIAIRYPSAAAGAFVIVFAVFAFADAILDLFVARAFRRAGARWGWYAFAAIISIAAGVLALVYPGLTFAILVFLIAARAIVTGIFELGAAFSWHLYESRWLLGLGGIVSIAFGVLLFASPAAGALALLWTIGVYAIVLGIMLVGLGVRIGRGDHHGTAATAAA